MKKELLRYQRLAGIITESQYTKKLNEGEGEAPYSITVKMLPKFSEGLKGDFKQSVQLNSNGINKKVGALSYESGEDKQTFYYAKYNSKTKQITVSHVNCFGYKAINSQQNGDLLSNQFIQDARTYDTTDTTNDNFCIFASGYDSNFEDGFEVGAKDHGMYFEIIETSDSSKME